MLHVPESEHVWQRRVHVYTGESGRVWNMWRMLRIVLAGVVRMTEQSDMLGNIGPCDREKRDRAISIQRHMANEICESVPSQLGYDSAWPTHAVLSANRCLMPLVWSAISLLDLRWHECTQQAMWIVGRLKFIATKYGVWKASVMAEEIQLRALELSDTRAQFRMPF